jgi:hypothetical protein
MTVSVPIGSIRLYDDVTPDVPAGVYRVRTSVDARDGGAALPPPVAHDAYVAVDGPRFVLSSADVASVHPPPGSVGAFGERLPHVALSRRTLPWERRFDDGTPWLALLVVREEEATVLPPQPLQTAVGEALFDVLAAAGDIDGDGPLVSVLLAASAITQAALLPRRRELSLLSHVRQVNLADSELAGADDDGWFAVVVANRLPTVSGSYRACLVSLEGREGLLEHSTIVPVPLVVLHHWGFEVGSGGVFEVLARDLDVAALRIPGAPAGPLDPPVPLVRQLRDGNQTAVTYLGPLRERPAPASPGPDASGSVGLEVAAELGRLMGTADGHFLHDVVGWHRTQDRLDVAAASALPQRGEGATPLPERAALAGRTAANRLGRRVADPWRVPHAVRPPEPGGPS